MLGQMGRSRWVWGVAGALITTYLIRGMQKSRPVSLNGNGILRKSVVEGVLQTGRAVLDRTIELAKTR